MENSHNEPKYIEVRGTCVHNLKNVNVNVPLHQIVGIAGVSGSGKTTMVLESLIPGLEASLNHTHLPEHVKSVVADGISHVKLIDASPIGINVRPHAIQAFFHTQEEGALLLFEEQICNCSVVPLSWQIACISANRPKPITELTCKFF